MNQHTLDVLEYGKVKELLVNYATSGLGKNLAQRIRPLTDVKRIEQLIAETTDLKSLLSPNVRLPLGGLHDLFPIMEKLDKGEEILPSEEIILIKETLRAGRIVKEYLQDTAEDYPNLRRFARSISTYPSIEEKIERAFDDGGAMRNSASPTLKSIRNQIQILRGRIRSKLQSVIRAKGINPYLQDTVVRERKGRPVLAVKERHADRVAGAIRDKSDSGNSLFIEPQAVLGMGDELQELMNAEKAEMVRIIREITAMIADKTEALCKTLKLLAHIDLTYAKVCLSRDYEMNPPLLNTDGVIDVNGARHPLLLALQREASKSDKLENVTEVVPIDFRLGDDFNTLIITGPNTLDELGGGTDPAEGAALGKSILEYLHERNVKTAVTTHISPLKNLGYTVPGIENASVEFDLATLQPTYKLLIGTPGSSNALAIAQRLGLPSAVIEGAETSSAKEDENVAKLINQLQSAKIIAEKNKRAAEVSKTTAFQLEQEYRLKLQKLVEQEKLLQKQFHKDAFAAVRKVKGQIARIRGAKSSSQTILTSLNEIYKDLSEQLAEFPEEEQRQEFIRQVAIGDKVRIQSLNRVGTISKMDKNTENIVVQLGMMQMTVPLEDIEMV
ncbi:TPA: hypothetical protein EYP66_07840 [Candidatus Poribacteria bacterium]|nr:hypothetical protein [Candidatus Poribacteria bacterium]